MKQGMCDGESGEESREIQARLAGLGVGANQKGAECDSSGALSQHATKKGDF
jgi:hypothetical protein